MNRLRTVLKVVIALVAAINIGLVFLTDDYTGFLAGIKERFARPAAAESVVSGTESTVSGSESVDEANPENAFVFDPETLVYNGTGRLDLLQGVSFGDLSPEEIRKSVFAKIGTGKAANTKVITYSIDTGSGTVTAQRALTLENYTGPKLTLPAEMPEISLSTLDTMGKKVAAAEGFSAQDGCGNDISSTLTCSVLVDSTDISNVSCNFSITNMFGDSDYASATVTPTIDLPFIELVMTEATYSPSNPFTGYYSNIKRVIDTDGSSIGSLVKCTGEVNTEVPGTYYLTYTVTNNAGLSAIPVTLTVHITA